MSVLPWELRRALGIRRQRVRGVDSDVMQPPDSAAAREAEQIVEAFAAPMVANHCYRTYAWGAALAAIDGRTYDPEAVYVASLLHDLYWAAPDAMPSPHCFTLPAADDAYVVFLGARLDVLGYRHWDLAPETVATVLQRYPRLDLKRESLAGFENQSVANRGTRVHFHTRYLASKWFCQRAPFDE